MKIIKDITAAGLFLLGFGITNGSANSDWSFGWAVLGFAIFMAAVMLFCVGRETNAAD